MFRSLMLTAPALTALLMANPAAAALLPSFDCQGFEASVSWGGYAYGVFSVQVVAIDADGGDTMIDTIELDAWKDFSTDSLQASHLYQDALPPGHYRLDMSVVVYANAYSVPTDEAMADWNAIDVWTFTDSSLVFAGCDGVTSNNCARTPGFWKNHPEHWPTHELTLGDTIYNADELASLFETTPGGNTVIKLIHHLIAAKFNLLDNDRSEVGSVDGNQITYFPNDDDDVVATIAYADELLTDYDISVRPRGAQRKAIGGAKDALDAFNNNELDGTCGHEPSTASLPD